MKVDFSSFDCQTSLAPSWEVDTVGLGLVIVAMLSSCDRTEPALWAEMLHLIFHRFITAFYGEPDASFCHVPL